MKEYMYLSILAIIFCLAIAIICLFLYCWRIERKCNHCIAKTIREQDRIIKELDRIHAENATIEKMLKIRKDL